MIKIENVEVVGWEHVIRGMRNPKNSWELSDSYNCHECYQKELDNLGEKCVNCPGEINIGPNDHKLMMSLAKGGPVHAKYRRMIVVYLDITAPLYWWKEFDTYKVGTVANSCSTMHKIHDKEFTLEDFSYEHLVDYSLDDTLLAPIDILKETIKVLNHWRERFNAERKTNEVLELDKKDMWWQMIQLLTTSYNQKRTVMLNYEVLHNMYFSREYHKLDEWRDLCAWIESLPYSEIITTKVKSNDDIHESLLAGEISINEARKRMGLEPIDATNNYVKDICIRHDISEEQMNEILDKFNAIPD